MQVELYGIRSAEDFASAIALGANRVGFDFRPASQQSPQMISSLAGILPDRADLESLDAHRVASSVCRVGLFSDGLPQDIITRIVGYRLDVVELYGEMPPLLISNLRRTIDPDIRVGVKFCKVLDIASAADLQRCYDYDDVADSYLFRTSDVSLLEGYTGRLPFFVEASDSTIEKLRHLSTPLFEGIQLFYSLTADMSIKPFTMA